MNKILFGFVVLAISSSTFAAASVSTQTFRGDQAKALAQALRLNGVLETSSNDKVYHFSAPYIHCHTADAYSDMLKRYECSFDPKKIRSDEKPGAKLLMDSLLSLGLNPGAGMSQERVTVTQVGCLISDDKGSEDAFICNVTGDFSSP